MRLGDWFSDPHNDPLHTYTNLKRARRDYFQAETELKLSRELVIASPERCVSEIKSLMQHNTTFQVAASETTSVTSQNAQNRTRQYPNPNPHDPNLQTIEQHIASELAAHERIVWRVEAENCSHK